MKDIILAIEVAATTAKTVYIPAPCRGNVARCYGVYNGVTNADDVVTLSRSTTAVASITGPGAATAAGTHIDGVADSTNSQLIFDPASTTVANQVIKVGFSNTFDAAGTFILHIEYDDSAYVEQESLHA